MTDLAPYPFAEKAMETRKTSNNVILRAAKDDEKGGWVEHLNRFFKGIGG